MWHLDNRPDADGAPHPRPPVDPIDDPIYARKCRIAFELFKLAEQDRRMTRRGAPPLGGLRGSIRNERELLEAELRDLETATRHHPN